MRTLVFQINDFMKNILILTLATFAIGFTSCQRKSYTCKCSGGISGGTFYNEITAKSREQAKRKCEANNPDPGEGTGNDMMYCELQ